MAMIDSFMPVTRHVLVPSGNVYNSCSNIRGISPKTNKIWSGRIVPIFPAAEHAT
jgi:hypothetical protein